MINKQPLITVALIDDHILLRNALASLIDGFGNCITIHESDNGKKFITTLAGGLIPDVVILDQNMPEMDGLETAEWLYKNHPQVHILMLTMYDSELSLIRLLQNGVKGFLKKDIHPSELKFAIESVMQSGYYYSNYTTAKLMALFRNNTDGQMRLQQSLLTDLEITFLKLSSTELTYKEIAEQMKLNPRTIDTLRDQLFTKLDVRSRVALAMMAIRHGIATF